MAYYFGFIPSEQLNTMIDEADNIIHGEIKTDYYPYRNALTQQIARELIDNLLVNLISVIPNPERKETMQKIVGSVESATESLLKVLLGKDDNQAVMASYYFLKDESMFIDTQGNRRIGFKLEDNTAQQILTGFDAIGADCTDNKQSKSEPSHNKTEQQQQAESKQFKNALETMNDALLTHFINRFTKTLPLGIFKRNVIPVARSGINAGLGIAINKLLPQLPPEALQRLVSFYRPFIVHLDDSLDE
ncbi:hypothetical protein [Psychrobacter sp. I-STPA10]|uniref:hypothetical protein n=1 Tax=Psychrobacter sp. I-STPA10 TaxID=2585769 RepID=UPI001E53C5F2|nr:hypothetical protein [Psychrobacter sp. I-STPA10]